MYNIAGGFSRRAISLPNLKKLVIRSAVDLDIVPTTFGALPNVEELVFETIDNPSGTHESENPFKLIDHHPNNNNYRDMLQQLCPAGEISL